MTNTKIKNTPLVMTGFGSESLNEVLPGDRPVREDIQVNAACFRLEELECCWIVLDFMDFDRKAIDYIKTVVSKSCSIPIEHIHILTTHNHSAGEADSLDIGLTALKSCKAVMNGRRNASPSFLRYARTNVDEQLNYVRRIYVEEFAGCSTIFWGPCAANKFDGAEFLKYQAAKLRKRGGICYCGKSDEAPDITGLGTDKETVLPPGDNTVSILLFEREDGAAIGSICRFAVHAVCCNRPEYYSSDYPYYVRKYLSEKLGGPAIFMNGPCGELAPCIKDKISFEERRIGQMIGAAAMRALAGKLPQAVTKLKDRAEMVILPVRKDLPDAEKAAQEIDTLQMQLASIQDMQLPEIKKIAERITFLQTTPFLMRKWLNGEPESTKSHRNIMAELGLLFLNDICILAFPGETFSSTAEQVRIQSGLTDLVTATEHGRTLMYVPAKEEYVLGGYETTCSITSPDAESILACEALKILHEIYTEH